MKRVLAGLLWVALLLPAQRIETATDSQDHVVKVQTALNHITLIQAPGDITNTAVGSKAFHIERQGNLVLIQPLQEGAQTNLFIWVGDRRFNYELLPPVSDAAQMDFAIDYRHPVTPAPVTSSARPPVVPADQPANVPADMLLKGTPVNLKGRLDMREGVGVVIHDFYQQSDTVYIRYTLVNRLDKAVRVGGPNVLLLSDARFSSSLFGLAHTQLGSHLASKIKSDATGVPLSLVQRNAGVTELAPNREQIGLFSIRLPRSTQPTNFGKSTVLRISFPIDQAQPAQTTLIL